MLVALGLAAACAGSPAPSTPHSGPAAAPIGEPSTPVVVPARAAAEVPTIPDGEDAQREHLRSIDEDCDVLPAARRGPPDLGSTQCLEQLTTCIPRLHGLALLAQSRHAAVKGRALALAARMHNIHRCGRAARAHPCSVDRENGQLGESALCAHVGWVPLALAEALSHPELPVREGAAEGLVNTVVPAEVLVPAVSELLRRYEPGPDGAELTNLVSVVLMALRVSGGGAAELVPQLGQLFAQRELHDERVIVDALHAVQSIGDGSALKPEVIEALGDRRSRVRLAAVEVLGRIGEREDAAELRPLLNDRDATVRQVARAMRQRLEMPRRFGRPGF